VDAHADTRPAGVDTAPGGVAGEIVLGGATPGLPSCARTEAPADAAAR
jgi:hypothetical protein